MREWLWGGLLAVLAASAAPADAADPPLVANALPASFDWSGFYIGGHLGGGAGTTTIASPFGPSLYGDAIRTPFAFAGVQAGYAWQAPSGVVLGIEADASAMGGSGTRTCLAASSYLISANCRARPDAVGSLTARLGVAAGPDGRSLLYLKGGAAWLATRVDVATNALPAQPAAVHEGTRWGWTVGVGYEQALTPAWSLRLEYSHARFDGGTVAAPPLLLQAAPPLLRYDPVPGGPVDLDHSLHLVRIGMNYRFGVDPRAAWAAPAPLTGAPVAAPDWRVEVGTRYWYSSGRFQKDLGFTTGAALQNVLISRLTYESDAHAGELFGRLDTPSGLFVKGFVGAGGLASGHMIDEDWLLDESPPYSNTLSGEVAGRIAYAVADIGYDVLRGAGYRVGGFAGYAYYREDKLARGCIQTASPIGICGGQFAMPLSVDVISEDDTWHALRLGIAGEVQLLPGLTLAAEAAYLPYARMTGVDGHLQRTDVANIWSPEFAKARGVQLEAVLSYALTPNVAIGIGGRYWAMWGTEEAYTNAFSSPCPCQTLPVWSERYGVFVQASYRFDARP